MTARLPTGDNELILAAALSAILGKEILSESSVPQHSQQRISKVSLFDQHLTSFVYGKVDTDDQSSNDSLMTLHITVLATKTTFTCLIERDASVDKLKQIVYEKEGILCSKQNLIYSGREIDDGHLLSEYDIGEASTIFVVRLRAHSTDDLLVLDHDSCDQRYDYDFTNIDDKDKHFTRGGVEYRRPCGGKRYAIKAAGKYENDDWITSNNGPNEWPVSYHGTGHDFAKSIAQAGYDLTKHKRFVHGLGIYTTPDVNVAKKYAKSFNHGAEEYYVILQNRVNPTNLTQLSNEETGAGEYWISPDGKDVRPYGVCIFKNK